MENERVVIRGYGAPSMLQVIHEPAPIPANGEVRIRVEAAGVSFGDVLQRLGLFFAGAPGMPYTPGYDVVGTVDAVGPDVDSVRVGDRVAALTLFGGYARYVCVPAEHVVTGVPGDLDAIKAVALVLNYTTAFQMLRRVANVRAGQSILVYGASGGVGTALLDLARHLGIIVAAAGSQRWQESFKGQAELLFDERDAASVETLRRFRPDGFDFAFDGLGGSHVWRTRSMVAKRGKLVAFGITSAVKPGRPGSVIGDRLLLLLAFAKVFRCPAVEAVSMDRHKNTPPGINEDIRAVIELLHNRAINPRIGATFALADAEQAHRLIESRNNVGKIVLVP
jgi:NADPH2:quinone reductase